jgi:hypothetical protein
MEMISGWGIIGTTLPVSACSDAPKFDALSVVQLSADATREKS